MTDKAYAVPLHELLVGVPRNTSLEITDPEGLGTRFIPVGRYCHEAAEALRARLAQPEQEPMKDWVVSHNEICVLLRQAHDALALTSYPPKREWVGLTDDEILADDVLRYHFGMNGGAGPVSKKGKTIIEAIEAKLKEKNHG